VPDRNLMVDTAALEAVSAELRQLAQQLSASAPTPVAGPTNQPSAAAAAEVSAAVGHVGAECGSEMEGYGDIIAKAAASYSSTDTAAASALSATPIPGR
jgi:Excreted virulence factor EspC, type VII ESX diderm